MLTKYAVPIFLNLGVTQKTYDKWLSRKAQSHLKRDRVRGNRSVSLAQYKNAIHDAVVRSNGRDEYTGEMLDWTLISTYNNEASKRGGRSYKAQFALVPTVDHVGDGLGEANFKICSWRTNDSKNDLDISQFIELCKSVLNYHGQTFT